MKLEEFLTHPTIVQQAQECNLFNIKIDTLWRLENSDTLISYCKGRTNKIITFYYSK